MSSTTLTPNLLVIDNIAAPFKLIPRFSFERRTKIIEKLVRDLRKISVRYNCAVLIINQVTRKMMTGPDSMDTDASKNIPQYQLIPMLGQIWRNHVDSSIYLSGDCEKGRYINNVIIQYRIDHLYHLGSRNYRNPIFYLSHF